MLVHQSVEGIFLLRLTSWEFWGTVVERLRLKVCWGCVQLEHLESLKVRIRRWQPAMPRDSPSQILAEAHHILPQPLVPFHFPKVYHVINMNKHLRGPDI
jgi:hypothetical protein